MRVAIADKLVAQGCVNCHNSHLLTPKNNWKLGNVRGILSVDAPINDQVVAISNIMRNLTLITIASLFSVIYKCKNECYQ